MRLTNIFAAIAVVLLASFSSFAKPDAKVEIRQVLNEQVAAWNRGDLEGFMFGYWRSDQLAFVSGDKITRGWQPTLDNYRNTYGSKEKMGILSFADLDITVLSKDAAAVVGSWSLARENDNPKGKFTLIFRRINGDWRIVHDHSS